MPRRSKRTERGEDGALLPHAWLAGNNKSGGYLQLPHMVHDPSLHPIFLNTDPFCLFQRCSICICRAPISRWFLRCGLLQSSTSSKVKQLSLLLHANNVEEGPMFASIPSNSHSGLSLGIVGAKVVPVIGAGLGRVAQQL